MEGSYQGKTFHQSTDERSQHIDQCKREVKQNYHAKYYDEGHQEDGGKQFGQLFSNFQLGVFFLQLQILLHFAHQLLQGFNVFVV